MKDAGEAKLPANQTVGIAGLGFMGRGIVACLVGHGFRVIAWTARDQEFASARQHIARSIGELIEHLGYPALLGKQWQGRYTEARSAQAFAGCDFVIESIVEDFEAKQALFEQIEAAVRDDVPIASNTSALPITALQARRRHPQRFIGMHWAAPAHATRFLEIVRGEQTSDAALAATIRLGEALGKEPSVVNRDIEGFIANRIGYAMFREAFHLLESGVADVQTIDRAFRNTLGLWATIAGPFRFMDLTGIPPYAAVMKDLFPTLSNATQVPESMQRMVESGAKGISNGHGFYEYTAEESAAWEKLYTEHAWRVARLMQQYFPLAADSPRTDR